MAKKVILASVIVLAVVGAVVLFLVRGKQQKDQIREQAYAKSIQAIESLGYTIDPQVLKKRLAIPAADNAAPIYRAVAKEFESGGKVDGAWTAGRDRAAVLATLDSQEPEIYKTLTKATTKDRCDLGWDWSLGPQMHVPEITWMKRMAAYCTYLAIADARRNDLDSALERLLVADRIGRHIAQEPISIANLEEYSNRTILLDIATKIVSSRPVDQKSVDFLRRLADSVQDLTPTLGSIEFEVLDGYLALHDYALEDIYSASSGQGAPSTHKKDFDPVPRQIAITLLLNRMAELHKIWSTKATGVEIGALVLDFDDKIQFDTTPGADLVRVMLPPFSGAYRSYAWASSSTDMLQYVGTLLGQYVSSNGKIDASSPPTDSYTGKPFVVTHVKNTLKVYSLGQNGTDDGGPRKPGYNSPIGGNDDFGFLITLNK